VTAARLMAILAYTWIFATPASFALAVWAWSEKHEAKGGAYRNGEPSKAIANQGGRGNSVGLIDSPAPAINQGEI